MCGWGGVHERGHVVNVRAYARGGVVQGVTQNDAPAARLAPSPTRAARVFMCFAAPVGGGSVCAAGFGGMVVGVV